MRSNWTTRKLGDVISLEYGKPLPKEMRCEQSGFPAYGANGIKTYSVESYCNEPSIVVGRKGTAGAVKMVEGGFWPLDVTYYVTFDSREYELKFLYYLLSSLDLPSLATGVKPGINRNVVYAIECSFPPLDDQKRIVAVLDEAFAGIDAAIANTEKNLANARELFESYLTVTFEQFGKSWVEVSLGDIAQIKGGKRVPKGYKLQTEPTRYPYISVADFNDAGSVDLDGVKYASEAIYKQISKYTISSKDLYISIAGTIGKSGIVPQELDGANLTENACKLILKEGVSNRFLLFFTKTRFFKEQALKNTRTAAQPKLALERLKTIKLALPAFEVQQRFVSQFDDIWCQAVDLETIYKKKLDALAELKQSLVAKAFAGELTGEPVVREMDEAVA